MLITVLTSRFKCSHALIIYQAMVRVFLRRIKARTLLILAKDGIFTKHFAFLHWCHSAPMGFIGRSLLHLFAIFLYASRAVWSKLAAHSLLTKKLNRLVRRIQWGLNLIRRLQILDAANGGGNLTYAELPVGGGHHPQLTMPDRVAHHVLAWRHDGA